jgi:hypothetical protein
MDDKPGTVTGDVETEGKSGSETETLKRSTEMVLF